jgi:hypothetical protein
LSNLESNVGGTGGIAATRLSGKHSSNGLFSPSGLPFGLRLSTLSKEQKEKLTVLLLEHWHLSGSE